MSCDNLVKACWDLNGQVGDEIDEERGEKTIYGLPEGYMIEHDTSPAILMDICPDLVCDDAIKPMKPSPSAEQLQVDHSDLHQDECYLDLEHGLQTPQGQMQNDDAYLGPRDSARSQHGFHHKKVDSN